MKPRVYLFTLWNTLSSPQFYLGILNQKLSFSWRFFFTSYVLLSLISTVLFIVIDVPQWRQVSTNVAQQLVHNYPNNLIVRWDEKTLSTQPAQALFVPYPQNVPQGNLPHRIAIINTQVTKIEDALPPNEEAPLSVITQNALYVSDLKGGWSSTPLQALPEFEKPFVINRENVPLLVTQAQKVVSQALIFTQIVYPALFFIFGSLVAILALAFNSFVIYFFVQLLGRPLSYNKVFQLSLHVGVVAELVQLVTRPIATTSELNMYGITFWLYMCLVLFTLRDVKQIYISKKN